MMYEHTLKRETSISAEVGMSQRGSVIMIKTSQLCDNARISLEIFRHLLDDRKNQYMPTQQFFQFAGVALYTNSVGPSAEVRTIAHILLAVRAYKVAKHCVSSEYSRPNVILLVVA